MADSPDIRIDVCPTEGRLQQTGPDGGQRRAGPYPAVRALAERGGGGEAARAERHDGSNSRQSGPPSARIVLLRSFDEKGFVFYTNYESRKGTELAANPHAALMFYWAELEKQVRVTGPVERVSREESEGYFHSRPPKSQLSAWSSAQSKVIPGREVLEAAWKQKEQEFDGKPIPLPPFWGGYRVRPEQIEFWQGRRSRLHDRLLYTKVVDDWRRERLAP